jgi:hypothetical protein
MPAHSVDRWDDATELSGLHSDSPFAGHVRFALAFPHYEALPPH